MESELMSVQLERDELDRNLGGGIPTKSLMLIEGKDGSGKSIFVQRLTYGLIRNGYSVTYISTELNTQGFIEQMASLDYDIKYDLLENKLLFIPMFPFVGNVKLSKNFFHKLINSKELFKNQVIIFDTLSFLLIQDSISEYESFEIIKFFKRLVSLNKTIILCVDPDHINQKFLTLLRSVSDVYFTVETKMFAGELIRVININRFKRCGNIRISQLPFKVEPGRGLMIEIASFS